MSISMDWISVFGNLSFILTAVSFLMKDMIQAGVQSQIRYGIGKEPGDYIRNTLTNWSTQTNWVLTAWC